VHHWGKPADFSAREIEVSFGDDNQHDGFISVPFDKP
jgi:hypothetical protein